MIRNAVWCILFLLLVSIAPARTDEPIVAFPRIEAMEQAAKDKPKDKPKPPDKDKKLTEPPKTDIFAPTALMGTQFPTGFNPQMMGDYQGGFARKTITVTGVQTITTSTTTRNPDINQGQPVTVTTIQTVPTTQTRTIVVPIFSAAAFKVAENESPRPQDRVFFTYNYFSNLQGPGNQPNDGSTPALVNQTNPGAGVTTITTSQTVFPGLPALSVNLHREVFGFEKTFLDGYASIEMRLPLLQQRGNIDGFSSGNIGDITIVGKYAFILDPQTGNVLSAGLAVTAPTGPSTPTIDGNMHSTLLQPWVGYIVNVDRLYLQAFHSIVIPTDPRDVTLAFNDVGVGYSVYRGGPESLLRFLTPTMEAHVTTPLNHRDMNGPIFAPDLVILTGGLHVGVGSSSTFSFSIAIPVTGPRAFGAEYMLQFNRRF